MSAETAIARADRALGRLLRAVPIACLTALFALLLVNAVARTFPLAGFAWFDQVVEGLFAWMVFAGAAALWRENDHFRVDWLERSVPGGPAPALRVLIAGLPIAFLAAMIYYGWDLTVRSPALTPILGLPTALFYLAIPFSGLVMLVDSVRDLARAVLSPSAPSAAVEEPQP